MSIWQLCANLLIPNCLRSNLSYSPLDALELYVTSGHSATYTVYGVEITEREDDRGNYDSWEENYTFAVTSGSPASRLDSYDRYNGEVSESMTSKEKSFTLVVDGVTVCSNEPISNVGKVDKVIGNYRYIF